MMPIDEIFDYFLWHPRRSGNAKVALDVTPGEKWNAPEPSAEFLALLARRLRTRSKIIGARILPFRSSYYSDPDATDWEDAWRIAWLLTLEFDVAEPSLPGWQNEYLGLVGYDAATFGSPAPARISCVIGVDNLAPQTGDQYRPLITGDSTLMELRGSLGAPEPRFSRFAIGQGIVHERIDLGTFAEGFFAAGADYARRVEGICRETGAFTNFETRSIEADEFYDEDGLV